MRVLGAVAVAAALALAPVAPGHAQVETPAPTPVDASWSGMEADFAARINGLRASLGLEPLTVHTNLVEKARSWAATMAGEGRIWHSHLQDGITVDWSVLGENVGMGPTVPILHDAFVASPTHYDNLVRPDYRYIGIGVVVAPNGTIFVAEEFMILKPAAEEAATAQAPAAASAPTQALVGETPVAATSLGSDVAAPSGDEETARTDSIPEDPEGTTAAHVDGLLTRLRLLDGHGLDG